jgi:hypothetical protein
MTRRGRPATGRGYEHARRIWWAMHSRSMPFDQAPAEVRALADPATVAPETRVFVGPLLRLFKEVGLSSSAQYHTVKTNLVAMGALVRLRRGNGRVTAVWLLAADPTVDRWGRYVEAPGTLRRLETMEAEHNVFLAWFLKNLPTIAPTLAAEMQLAGVRTVGQAIDHLRQLPPARLAGLGPAACMHFIDRNRDHTCGVEAPLSRLRSPATLVE